MEQNLQLQQLTESLEQTKAEILDLLRPPKIQNHLVLNPRSQRFLSIDDPDPVLRLRLMNLLNRVESLESQVKVLKQEQVPSALSLQKLPESILEDSYYLSDSQNAITNDELKQIIQGIVARNNDL